MPDRIAPDEVALLIRAKQILKAKGLSKDADVKSICEAAGISRKTGYQWARSMEIPEKKDNTSHEEMAQLRKEYKDLKKQYRRLEAINEGHRLAWEIHDVDELLAAKKNTKNKVKKRRR
jgi:hypothetical protein